VAELVVQALEVVDVEQADRQLAAAALERARSASKACIRPRRFAICVSWSVETSSDRRASRSRAR
jgi:hypothetical protein